MERDRSREILRIIGYVVSLKKNYFRVKDLTNMLGVKTNGRHRLSYSLKALISQELIEIHHKNDRNTYYIPVQEKLLNAYYECLWNQFKITQYSAPSNR